MRALVVDAANVVGSRPDGWWRDRAGAAARLRDRLARADLGYDEVVLVVEGAARRGVEPSAGPGLRVVHAAGSGDDAVVREVERLRAEAAVTVATSDRGLRSRVTALGAAPVGPRWLLDLLPPP